jgi:hypothetical protein
MTPEIIASYTGFTKREIKRWCKPKHFNKLEKEKLERIAQVLKMDLQKLVTVD